VCAVNHIARIYHRFASRYGPARTFLAQSPSTGAGEWGGTPARILPNQARLG